MISQILWRATQSPVFDRFFDYRSVIGKLGYLGIGSRRDTAYMAHQCVRFRSDLRTKHGNAIRWLGRYIKQTRDKGIIMRPKSDRSLEIYVDANFTGNWDPDEAKDVDTAQSIHGFFIYYARCPIT